MSGESFEQRFERHVEYMLEQQARFDERLTRLERLTEENTSSIERLTASLEALTENVEAMRAEMRQGFENLIVANEVTRDLAEKVARLAI